MEIVNDSVDVPDSSDEEPARLPRLSTWGDFLPEGLLDPVEVVPLPSGLTNPIAPLLNLGRPTDPMLFNTRKCNK